MQDSPHMALLARFLAPDYGAWTQGWTETHSRSYGLRETQVPGAVGQARGGREVLYAG